MMDADAEEIYRMGDTVEVHRDRIGGAEWHPGRITEVHRDGTYDVRYDDGDEERRVQSRMIRLADFAPKPEPAPAPKPEPAPEPEPEPEPAPAPELEPEPAPEPEAAAEPEPAPEPELAAEPEPQPEPDSDPEPLNLSSDEGEPGPPLSASDDSALDALLSDESLDATPLQEKPDEAASDSPDLGEEPLASDDAFSLPSESGSAGSTGDSGSDPP